MLLFFISVITFSLWFLSPLALALLSHSIFSYTYSNHFYLLFSSLFFNSILFMLEIRQSFDGKPTKIWISIKLPETRLCIWGYPSTIQIETVCNNLNYKYSESLETTHLKVQWNSRHSFFLNFRQWNYLCAKLSKIIFLENFHGLPNETDVTADI